MSSNENIERFSNSLHEFTAQLMKKHFPATNQVEKKDVDVICKAVADVSSDLLSASLSKTNQTMPEENNNNEVDDGLVIEKDLTTVLEPLNKVVTMASARDTAANKCATNETDTKEEMTPSAKNDLSNFQKFKKWIKKSKSNKEIQKYNQWRKELKFKHKAIDLSNLKERQYLELWALAAREGTPLNIKVSKHSSALPTEKELQIIRNIEVPNFKPLTEENLQQCESDKPDVSCNLTVELKDVAMIAQSERSGEYIPGPNMVNGKAYWIQKEGSNYLWYDKKFQNWRIGQKLGGSTSGLRTKVVLKALNEVIGPVENSQTTLPSAPSEMVLERPDNANNNETGADDLVTNDNESNSISDLIEILENCDWEYFKKGIWFATTTDIVILQSSKKSLPPSLPLKNSELWIQQYLKLVTEALQKLTKCAMEIHTEFQNKTDSKCDFDFDQFHLFNSNIKSIMTNIMDDSEFHLRLMWSHFDLRYNYITRVMDQWALLKVEYDILQEKINGFNNTEILPDYPRMQVNFELMSKQLTLGKGTNQDIDVIDEQAIVNSFKKYFDLLDIVTGETEMCESVEMRHLKWLGLGSNHTTAINLDNLLLLHPPEMKRFLRRKPKQILMMEKIYATLKEKKEFQKTGDYAEFLRKTFKPKVWKKSLQDELKLKKKIKKEVSRKLNYTKSMKSNYNIQSYEARKSGFKKEIKECQERITQINRELRNASLTAEKRYKQMNNGPTDEPNFLDIWDETYFIKQVDKKTNKPKRQNPFKPYCFFCGVGLLCWGFSQVLGPR